VLKLFLPSLLLSALLVGPTSAIAQKATTPTVLTVSGAGLNTTTFTAAELAKAPHLTITANDRDGKPHRYEGVGVEYLLTTAGLQLDRHGDAIRKTLVVTAQDGYCAVCAVGEAMTEIATQPLLLADRCDGLLLPAGSGPWQLIVPADRKPTRWVRQVQELKVVLM
jgi:hypothetical protein